MTLEELLDAVEAVCDWMEDNDKPKKHNDSWEDWKESH